MIDLLPSLLAAWLTMVELCPLLRCFLGIAILCLAIKFFYFLTTPEK